jgi:uncharacterized ubiquitin-like protein YukD
MGEVRYSINGNYFKSFGIYVSESKGLGDTLKRKKSNSFDWSEYNGSSIDLMRPRYESREIELNCFIEGPNWQLLFDKFNTIIRDEFSKSGTQRLLIEPFGYKAMPYEVYLEDSVQLTKRFKDGQMFGTFSLKLIEPNPIKKVIYFTGSSLNLSYNSQSETEIFYGNGLKETAKGNVSLSGKVLANKVVNGDFNGRNLVLNSNIRLETNSYYLGEISLSEDLIENQEYTITFYGILALGQKVYIGHSPSTADVVFSEKTNEGVYQKTFVFNKDIDFPNDFLNKLVLYNYPNTGNLTGYIKKIKLEKSNKATDWTPAPEEEKYIIIAGNVDEITNVTTNGDVLWEKL